MLNLALPWWEFIVRGAVVYGALLVMVRLSGRRTVGQFTPFDLLVVMLLSESVANSLIGSDESLIGGLIVATTLIVLNITVAFFTAHSNRFAKFIDGTPVLLARDGVIFSKVRKAVRVSEEDIEQALREADCGLDQVSCIFLEADGKISVLQKKA